MRGEIAKLCLIMWSFSIEMLLEIPTIRRFTDFNGWHFILQMDFK